jgi:uncharacterized protein YecE (DUF72 family)
VNTFIGTSGFQYPAWRGTFYPEKLSPAKMLPFYAGQFPTTEINYTFHRIPSPKTISGWVENTPEGFKFGLKGPQRVTHFSKLRDCSDTVQYFTNCVLGLGNKLGPILFQLPPSFSKDLPVLKDFLAILPIELSAAFEFRHSSWFDDEVFTVLRQHRSALCIADTLDLTAPKVGTAPFGYLRLRREDYTDADLGGWAEFIRGQENTWRQLFVYFKHEESGLGPKLAKQMLSLLAR